MLGPTANVCVPVISDSIVHCASPLANPFSLCKQFISTNLIYILPIYLLAVCLSKRIGQHYCKCSVTEKDGHWRSSIRICLSSALSIKQCPCVCAFWKHLLHYFCLLLPLPGCCCCRCRRYRLFCLLIDRSGHPLAALFQWANLIRRSLPCYTSAIPSFSPFTGAQLSLPFLAIDLFRAIADINLFTSI